MDVDPITHDDAVAEIRYECHIESEFERLHGWHVNLMPDQALDGLPHDWKQRFIKRRYGMLSVEVPAPGDLLVPKLKRGERRDLAHQQWAVYNGLLDDSAA